MTKSTWQGKIARTATWDNHAIKTFYQFKLNRDLNLQHKIMQKYLNSKLKPGKEILKDFIEKEIKLWEAK